MNKWQKRMMAILTIFTLLSISVVTAQSAVIKNVVNENEDITSEKTTKTVTVYRFGTDGSVQPVNIEIDVEDGQDINDVIAEKCEQMMENDLEFQSLALNNTTSFSALSIVKSKGRGLHLKLSPRIQYIKNYKLFPMLPPYFRTAIFIPIVFCKYSRDLKASTTIKPLLNPNNTRVLKGIHSVLCVGFYGFKWWIGRVSLLGFALRTGFVGLSMITVTKQYPIL
jgi:hypothetical protein